MIITSNTFKIIEEFYKKTYKHKESNTIFREPHRFLFLNLIKNLLPKSPACVEIGTHLGHNASRILDILTPSKLFLIDIKFNPLFPVEDNIKDAITKNTCKAITSDSSDVKWVPEGMLFDYIYIDGDHSYDKVTQDINTWFPFVKPNGIIAGHDYSINEIRDKNTNSFGVVRAVNKFFLERKDEVRPLPQRIEYVIHKDIDINDFNFSPVVCGNEWALIKSKV